MPDQEDDQEQGLLAPSSTSQTQNTYTSYTSSASRAAHTSLNTEYTSNFESSENTQTSSGGGGQQSSFNFVSLQDDDTFQGAGQSNTVQNSENVISLQDSSTHQDPVVVEGSTSNVQSSSNFQNSSNSYTSQNANASYTAETSHQDEAGEEDGLLGGGGTSGGGGQPPKKTSSGVAAFLAARWREVGLGAWAVAATAAVIVLAVLLSNAQQSRCNNDDPQDDNPHKNNSDHHRHHHHHHHHHHHNHTDHRNNSDPDTGFPSGKRNLIFMVSDGMGPSSLSLTRSFSQHINSFHTNHSLPLLLDSLLLGQSRTRSSNSWVTDSAAGATAFSCGIKTYNGAVAVLPSHEPCGSVMEAAKRVGYTTGLVVTTRVTDATPAAFVSHVDHREMEDEIALQMIGSKHPLGEGRMVDLLFGGGRCRFLPGGTFEGCREDGENVIVRAKEQEGWGYISSREEFDRLGEEEKVGLPLLGLFAYEDFPYEIDRRFVNETYPSLEEMTRKALRILDEATKDSEQGFFIMIEGSLIDHAGHANDPAGQVHEVLGYDRAMAAVLEFINGTETPTLLVATSDHETGGLAIARQLQPEYPDYLWYPEVLGNVSHSASFASHEYHKYLRGVSDGTEIGGLLKHKSHNGVKQYLYWLVGEALGIEDPTRREIEALVSRPEAAIFIFADMVSRRAQIGWSTHGHTAADVNIYTSDPYVADALRGNHENTEIGKFLRAYLDLNDEVEKVTKLLVKHKHKHDKERGKHSQSGDEVVFARPATGSNIHVGL